MWYKIALKIRILTQEGYDEKNHTGYHSLCCGCGWKQWVKSGEDGKERNQEREWLFKGQAAIVFGRYDEAIACFEKVLAVNPEFTDAHPFTGALQPKVRRAALMSGKGKSKITGTKTVFQKDKRSILQFVPKLRKVKKKRP